jgi:hypothetical protein
VSDAQCLSENFGSETDPQRIPFLSSWQSGRL